MTDQKYVRSAWKSVKESEYDPHEGYSTPQTSVDFGPYNCTEIKKSRAWAAAAEFTRERLEQIRQVEEEILWIASESSMSDGYPYPAALRIIHREQAALAELRRGMK